MSTKLRVYVNEDDALLFWSISKPIPGCRGFAIQRHIKRKGKKKTDEDFLLNRIGFANKKPLANPKTNGKANGTSPNVRPSTEWPFQKFSWTDHDAQTGDTVSYRVIPMIRNAGGALEQKEAEASVWSPPRVLGTTKGQFKPFFNRGFVMSQFMARFLKEKNLTPTQFKETIKDKDDTTIRHFLSGDLRLALLNELDVAFKKGGQVFAALFELSDDELIGALEKLGNNANVVLANGSVQAKKGETSVDARRRDENKDARKRLLKKGVDVKVERKDRFISPGALGHNKFLVRTDKKGKPLSVWTGSTNWAPTGLCTQVNNGILIENPDVAAVYLKQWHALREAKSEFPKPFIAANSQPKAIGHDKAGSVRSIVWFTRTSKGVDLEALEAEVRKAKEGILFLMFMPGAKGVLAAISELSHRPDLYVRGVVSTLPKGFGDESQVDVKLINGEERKQARLNIIQPEGVKHRFAKFAAEVTRSEFLSKIGHAIIHSKVLVIDPFSEDPVVITGSHNFSGTASTKNDENFIIVKGDRDLAEAYAVNIMGAYAHYRWRIFLSETNRSFDGLQDDDKWQRPRLDAAKRDLKFFGV